jgi:hypothetical protein
MTFTEEDIHKVYQYCYQTSTSKGKIKQHMLNEIVVESIMRENEDNITFDKEIKVECNWGERFNVDVIKYKNNLLEEIILIKAPASNIAQNLVNSLNNQAGEFQRINGDVYKGSKIRQITFIPNVSPFFSKNEEIKSFEKNKSIFITKRNIRCYLNIQEIHVTFDINGIENCKTKQDVHNLFIDNNPITNVVVETSDYISNV